MLLDSDALSAQADSVAATLKAGEVKKAVRQAGRVSTRRMAMILKEVPSEVCLEFFAQRGWVRSAAILDAMPPEFAVRLLKDLAEQDEDHAGTLFSELEPGVAAVIIRNLPEDLAGRLLDQLDEDHRADIDQLLNYEPHSAGAQMSPYYLSVTSGTSVERARAAVRDAPSDVERSAYVYVLGGDRRLSGVISVRELMLGSPTEKVDERMTPDVFAVRDNDPALEAAQRIRTRNLKLLPVVNEQDQLLGVINIQRAVDLLSQEVADEFAGMGAASRDESFFTTPRRSISKRLPWMASNVFLNLGAVAVIASFEDVIVQVAILAAFLPMITDMGGNVGIQALSVSIRSMALGEARLRDVWKAMRKELYIGLFNGLCLGLLFGVIVMLMQQNMVLALVAGLALACNVLLAGVVGGTIPFLIKRLGKDPAMMTGPVLTTITDITGVTIYLGLSTLFLASMMAVGA